METNFEKLEAVLEANKGLLKEIYDLQKQTEAKKELIFKAIGDVSETFTEEGSYDHEDKLTDTLYEISSDLDVVYSGHYKKFGKRIEFWVPSTC